MERRIFLYALIFVVVASLLEAVVLSRSKNGYDWRAMGVSFFSLVARTAVSIALPLTLAEPLFAWAWEHRIATMPLNSALAFVVLFVGLEFCYYWFHRASHRMRWFWANHAVHHSPNDLTLAAALRFGIFGKFIGTAVFFVPLVWLGFSTEVVLTSLALNLLYQFWIHATWIPKLGWLEYALNTPSAHRVHHAANLEYLDANYGGVLVLFDRLFGTYRAEREDVSIRYGLVKPQLSYNPLKVEMQEWWALCKDLARARSLKAAVGHIVMPPGWQPDGKGETTEALRQQASTLRAPSV
ncbi:MAG: fatty acid hydroxylase [Burkholderiales bacterium PBB3]|nr:MAG: fatty acid hydroxylase [Burkholderiales bacterium PBB3]